MTPLPKVQYLSIQEIIRKPCNVLGSVLGTEGRQEGWSVEGGSHAPLTAL